MDCRLRIYTGFKLSALGFKLKQDKKTSRQAPQKSIICFWRKKYSKSERKFNAFRLSPVDKNGKNRLLDV